MTRRRLSDTGEHAWIARLLRRLPAGGRGVVVGPGDDAAIVRTRGQTLAITTDSQVEGVHFRREWCSPRALGRRAFRVNASDVAAMGGRPWLALVNLVAPADTPTRLLDGVMDGFAHDARAAGTTVVGGNLARGRDLTIAVTLLGEVPGPILRRAGARPGDEVWLTGTVGGTGRAVRERLAGRQARLPELPRRWDLAVRAAPLVHAAIDISDGLLQDVRHIARASGVRLEIDLEQVPCAPRCQAGTAATAGEDYELVLVVPPTRAGRLRALAGRLGCPVTRIGRVVAGVERSNRGVRAGGFDHYIRRS